MEMCRIEYAGVKATCARYDAKRWPQAHKDHQLLGHSRLCKALVGFGYHENDAQRWPQAQTSHHLHHLLSPLSTT